MSMEKPDKVSNLHPDYADLQKSREIVQTVHAGTKAMRRAGAKFLPKFPEELTEDYKKRLAAATLLNLYKSNIDLMCGLVFKDEIELKPDVPPAIKTLAENIDKKGSHLNVFAEKAFRASLEGCAVIQIDAPVWSSDMVKSQADFDALDLAPYWILWDADSVINWNERINPVSKRTEFDLMVFKEIKFEKKGQFGREKVVYYRVLFLDEMNRAAWQLHKEEKNPTTGVKEIVEVGKGVITIMNNGQPSFLSHLPVAVIGKLGDEPPMLDLAFVNIKHFQKESNFDNLEFQAAVPLFYTKGFQGKESLPVGANMHYQLPKEGDIGWAQIDSSGFESMRESIKTLETQMSMIGLSMLTDKTAKVDITATQAILDNISETSELRVRATNAKDAYERAMQITGEYLGLGRDAGGSIELGTAWKAAKIAADGQIAEEKKRADSKS